MAQLVLGPTFEEMLHPETIDADVRARAVEMKARDPLDPINLYNISWRNADNQIYYFVLPKELTGVEANIVALYGKDFPTGAHKVGAAYSVLVEKELAGEVDPRVHTIVWPSTGNYGIGGAAGDRLKQMFPDCKVVGLEPVQCPTLYNNGYGTHDIQGIGDKHVTWIHHVTNMDAIMCVDDVECKKGLQMLTEENGMEVLAKR